MASTRNKNTTSDYCLEQKQKQVENSFQAKMQETLFSHKSAAFFVVLFLFERVLCEPCPHGKLSILNLNRLQAR